MPEVLTEGDAAPLFRTCMQPVCLAARPGSDSYHPTSKTEAQNAGRVQTVRQTHKVEQGTPGSTRPEKQKRSKEYHQSPLGPP